MPAAMRRKPMALTWAVRIVRGEDGRFHAFASEDDYKAFKQLSPTNYR